MSEHAAIILAAGKGTRMGSAPINKVCFDCAGVPVIRRIVRNMRTGGITRFVIVVGHRAESVMRALDGEPDILWAYQAEQKGTGHAAECGIKALESIGFSGSVVITMGDKIIVPSVIRSLLDTMRPASPAGQPLAVLGVQPNPGKTSKGHVVVRDGKVLGIVEAKDIQKAQAEGRAISLCDRSLSAAEVAATPFVNAALYGYDVKALATALKTLRPDNAQGELYLTDTIEYFARQGSVGFYRVNPAEMLTYSTRPELRAIAHTFLRPASSFGPRTENVEAFIARFGDRPCVVASAPGRVNLMGRHIEHRGGSTNMMATDQRLTLVVAPRADNLVRISNLDPAFPDAEFRIPPCDVAVAHAASQTAAWLDYLDSPSAKAELQTNRGHWMNYVKSAVYRFQLASDLPLCGMDILAAGNIPVAAGLSSSSALVVATAEALVALNELNLSTREFVDLCGEGEWFVGSRGGSGDHAAMKCSRAGRVTHLKFKPFEIGESVPFPPNCSVIVVNSGEMAKKSEGARETFNARIRDYETAFNDIRRHFPSLPITYFRDLAFLPEKDLDKAMSVLSGTVKGVATFGVKECRRAEACLDLLKTADLEALGAMMKASHDGDRLGKYEYECSTPRIDALCDRLNAFPGVYGSQLVGAGLGGCVIALVANAAVEPLLASLKDEYTAFACAPSEGSRVDY